MGKRKTYTLRDKYNHAYQSDRPGIFGGHKKHKIYGRLDCPSALRWLVKGHYEDNRVFFANKKIAKSAGYRPCGVCMKDEYTVWKATLK